MKKFMNDPLKFVDEFIEGILYAHPDKLKSINGDLKCLVRADEMKKKVGIVTGGGSGHLPLFLGYVGKGLLDGVAVGNVFASPSAQQMLDVTKEVNRGKGILYLYGNYGGDVMNFTLASEMAEMEDIKTKQVLGSDDVSSATKGEESRRRGVAGIFYAFKIAGACAETGASLEEVAGIAQETVDNTRTMGVALSPCIIPEVGKPTFTIGEDEMELGMGIHGERGIKRSVLEPADDVAQAMLDKIFEDFEYKDGDEVSVLINGLGATPLEELYIIYRKVFKVLEEKGIKVYKPYIGEFATSMEMSGLSISILKLNEKLKKYLDVPCETPFFKQV